MLVDTNWKRFLNRRFDLTSRMALTVCNGCDGCGGRCIAGFSVTRDEHAAMAAAFAALPPEEQARIASQEKTSRGPGAEDTGATVTHCRFRDTEQNQCSIYEARPTICRLFGQTDWLPCPIEAVPHYPSDAASVLESVPHL